MCFVIALSIAKIYISNQIYYISKKINKLEIEISALREENSILSMNIEKLRYKTEILDNSDIENEDLNSTTEANSTQTVAKNGDIYVDYVDENADEDGRVYEINLSKPKRELTV